MDRLRPGMKLSPSGLIVLGPNGRSGKLTRTIKGLCTWCGNKVTAKNRSTWCSNLCRRKFDRTQPSVLRADVEVRDGAVCQLCRLDCYDMREAMLERAEDHGYEETARWLTDDLGLVTKAETVKHLLCNRRTVYDVDHITPVSEATRWRSLFDVKNLRTLCYWCHQADTAEIAARRSSLRRRAKTTP